MFDVSIKGSVLLLALVTIVFLIGALGMGLLISTIAETQQIAFMIAVPDNDAADIYSFRIRISYPQHAMDHSSHYLFYTGAIFFSRLACNCVERRRHQRILGTVAVDDGLCGNCADHQLVTAEENNFMTPP